MTFENFCDKVTKIVGSKYAFLSAIILVVGWAIAGFYYHWSDSHSLFINTTTTIITFFIAFIIQRSSNKDTTAIQIKLDEIIRAIDNAKDSFRGIEKMTEEEIKKIKNTD